jgi:hypothetical protein
MGVWVSHNSCILPDAEICTFSLFSTLGARGYNQPEDIQAIVAPAIPAVLFVSYRDFPHGIVRHQLETLAA